MLYSYINPGLTFIAEYFPIVYDWDNWAIGHNLKPGVTITEFVEMQSVTSVKRS